MWLFLLLFGSGTGLLDLAATFSGAPIKPAVEELEP
jgi:hypothetical protein